MTSRLPWIGLVSYRGYRLPPVFKATVSSRTVYDLANRTSKYVQYVFRISWEVTGGDGPTYTEGAQTDANVEQIRRCLMEPGGEFYFTNQGFGEVHINGGGVPDAAFGPTPLDFEWAPIGSNRAGRVTWTVEVHKPECCQSDPATTGQPMEFTFEVNYSHDAEGMTTRTVTGTIEIPMTRNGHAIQDIADNYRNRIDLAHPILPVNFKRTKNFNISRDGRTLNFSIVDTEISSDNAYPPGITDVDVRFSISNRKMPVGNFLPSGEIGRAIGSGLGGLAGRWGGKALGALAGRLAGAAMGARVGALGGWVGMGVGALLGYAFSSAASEVAATPRIRDPRWYCTLSGTYRVLAGEPRNKGYQAFLQIIADRQGKIDLGRVLRDGQMQLNQGSWLLVSEDFSEELYDRSVSFAVSWIQLTYQADIMKATGMWQPVPGGQNWNAWQASMQQAFGADGMAELKSVTEDHVIVDLCQDGTPQMAGDTPPKKTNVPPEEYSITTVLKPRSSWIDYHLQFNYHQDINRVKHDVYQPMQPSVTNDQTWMGQSDKVGGINFRDAAHAYPSIIQTRGAPSYLVSMSGYAVRAGYEIPIPELITVGGRPAYLLEKQPSTAIISYSPQSSGGVPIYATSWTSLYTIDDAPAGTQGAPANYLAGIGGDSNAA